MEQTEHASATIPRRALYPLKEGRQLLGNIGHTTLYQWVKDGRIRLTRIGGRSFLSASEIERLAGEMSEEAA